VPIDSWPWPSVAPGQPSPRRRRTRTPWGFVDLLLVFLVGLFLAAVLVVAAVGLTFVAAALVGYDVPGTVWFGVISTAVYLAFALAVWLMVVERRAVPWQALGFRPVRPGLLAAMVPLGVGLLILNVALLAPLTYFLNLGDPDAASSQNEVFNPDSGLSLLELVALAVPIALLAPVVEELLFRGLLYRYLRGRLGVVVAVVLSALIFGALHVVIPPLVVMGIVLAIIAQRTGSIWPGIVVHATNNALVVLALWLTTTSG
jgi:membrane protease YdiL (CAAX protease family)